MLTKRYIPLGMLIVKGITFQHTETAGIKAFFHAILEGIISGGLGVKFDVSGYVPKRQKSLEILRGIEINVPIFHL